MTSGSISRMYIEKNFSSLLYLEKNFVFFYFFALFLHLAPFYIIFNLHILVQRGSKQEFELPM